MADVAAAPASKPQAAAKSVAQPASTHPPAGKPPASTASTTSAAPTASNKPKADSPEPPADADDVIDMDTFQQILDLDEGDDLEFSRGMVWDYFGQAETTFKEMDTAHERKDLDKLASLGHFLKGSSAQLGVEKVQHSCENIQHYGHKRDEDADVDLTAAEALDRIDALLKQVKKDYRVAKRWLRRWYAEHGGLPSGDEGDA